MKDKIKIARVIAPGKEMMAMKGCVGNTDAPIEKEEDLLESKQEIEVIPNLGIIAITWTVNRYNILLAAAVVMIKSKNRTHPAQKFYL
jgi:hypothetical protein